MLDTAATLLQNAPEPSGWWPIAIAALGLLVGGGFLAKWVRGAAVNDLRATFVAKDSAAEQLRDIFETKESASERERRIMRDIQGVSEKTTAMTNLTTSALEKASDNAERIIALEQADRLKWRPITDTLQRITDQITAQGQQLVKVATTVDEATRRLAELEKRRQTHEARDS